MPGRASEVKFKEDPNGECMVKEDPECMACGTTWYTSNKRLLSESKFTFLMEWVKYSRKWGMMKEFMNPYLTRKFM